MACHVIHLANETYPSEAKNSVYPMSTAAKKSVYIMIYFKNLYVYYLFLK